jgi:hypothetical protein
LLDTVTIAIEHSIRCIVCVFLEVGAIAHTACITAGQTN